MTKTSFIKTLSLVLFVLLSLVITAIPSLAVEPVLNRSPEVIARGGQQFQKLCAGCHGGNAKGGRGSDLTAGRWRWGGSDIEIAVNIRKGIPGTQMPPSEMSEKDALEIVSFLRTLSPEAREPVTGDPEAGRMLFHGAAGCINCHFFNGSGGRLGPDLSKVYQEKNVGDLRKAIVDPSDTLRPGFETVEVELPDGRILKGVKKNDDTFSLQFLDTNERFQLHLKENLARFTESTQSLMPRPELEPAHVEDLIAFLYSPADTTSAASSDPHGDSPRHTSRNRSNEPWTPSSDLNISSERLKQADQEPHNWLTYWGDLGGMHYSRLDQINTANVQSLSSEWAYQFGGTTVQTTPLVSDGVMFITGPLNDAAALDARTGAAIWRYRRKVPDDVHNYCTVMTNRGFAALGDRLYMATLDTHLVALDAKTGNTIWDVEVDDYKKGYSITLAPLALDGKVFVGVTSGECGLNGFVDAFDAETGKKLWRFWTIPQEGDPARSTWSGDSANFGGGPTWLTGTYDVETDTLYWTTGNPAPDFDGTVREGDNLYTCSVLALDPNTGRLKWHFQHTPHDTHDWDSNQAPVLLDAVFKGKPRKLLIQAVRNGFYYVLDRLTGEFLLGRAYIHQTWADGLTPEGRPIVIPKTDPTEEGNRTCPDLTGGTNWGAPSYSPQTNLFYVSIREACSVYTSKTKTPIPGHPYTGTGEQFDPDDPQGGAIVAMDPLTGDIRWRFELNQGRPTSGVLATEGGIVFGGTLEGYLVALDAKSGRLLWRQQLGGQIYSTLISYAIDGRQFVSAVADGVLNTFALPVVKP